MLLSERQAQIDEMIRQQDFIRVEVLAGHCNVPNQTIRRDLNLLCDRGIARRLHGGVQRMNLPGKCGLLVAPDIEQSCQARHCPGSGPPCARRCFSGL